VACELRWRLDKLGRQSGSRLAVVAAVAAALTAAPWIAAATTGRPGTLATAAVAPSATETTANLLPGARTERPLRRASWTRWCVLTEGHCRQRRAILRPCQRAVLALLRYGLLHVRLARAMDSR